MPASWYMYIIYPRKQSPSTGRIWVTDDVAKEDGASKEADLSRTTLDLLGK